MESLGVCVCVHFRSSVTVILGSLLVGVVAWRSGLMPTAVAPVPVSVLPVVAPPPAVLSSPPTATESTAVLEPGRSSSESVNQQEILSSSISFISTLHSNSFSGYRLSLPLGPPPPPPPRLLQSSTMGGGSAGLLRYRWYSSSSEENL